MKESIGRTSTVTSGESNVRINVVAWDGPKLPKGAKLRIESNGQFYNHVVELTDSVSPNDTTIDVVSFTPTVSIPADSRIYVSEWDYHDRKFKVYDSLHVHMYHTGSTHGNDYLPNYSHYNFNVNASSVLTDGASRPNRWNSQFSFFNSPEFDCKIERIIYRTSSDAGTGEDWKIRVWSKPTDENGQANTNLSLIEEHEFISQNNQNFVHAVKSEPDYSMAEGDSLILSFAKSGENKSSSTKFYADIEFIISYYI